MEGGSVGHIFERDPPKDHPCQFWFNLVQGNYRLLGASSFLILSLFILQDQIIAMTTMEDVHIYA
jgi:hypothetical protein